MTTPHFPHEKLDAFHLARDAYVQILKLVETVPRGFGDDTRQLRKAAGSVVRNICEGAGRFKPLEKVQKYETAAGEVVEAAGTIHLLLAAGVADPDVAAEALRLLGRTNATLTGLVRRHRR